MQSPVKISTSQSLIPLLCTAFCYMQYYLTQRGKPELLSFQNGTPPYALYNFQKIRDFTVATAPLPFTLICTTCILYVYSYNSCIVVVHIALHVCSGFISHCLHLIWSLNVCFTPTERCIIQPFGFSLGTRRSTVWFCLLLCPVYRWMTIQSLLFIP